MRALLKRLVLTASKHLGLFRLGRFLTRHQLRILCYHSTSSGDEVRLLPKLFISARTFERRLRYLKRHGFPVLGLEDAVARLRTKTLPSGATVITIDDGWHGTYRYAWPLLKRFEFPATLYVTSHYVIHDNPVFDVTVDYMLRKSPLDNADLSGLPLPVTGRVRLDDPQARARLLRQLGQHAERCDEPTRDAVARALAAGLDVDYDRLVSSRTVNLMSLAELKELAAGGLDIQSHTHRHRFPDDEPAAIREIQDNRSALEPALGRRLEHFCYPSGIWSERQWPWLSASGIKTATTCDVGLNDRDTPPLALKRFLDGENIAQIEFEAEVCGFAEMLRRARRLVQRIVSYVTYFPARN